LKPCDTSRERKGNKEAHAIREIRGNTLVVTNADANIVAEIGTDTRITATSAVAAHWLKAGQRITASGRITGTTMTASAISDFADAP
jgi:hypothetical protein